jgi:predicted DNA-binding WGR domain protein
MLLEWGDPGMACCRMILDLHLNRIDCARNMARYYGLAVEQTLFGEWMLFRRWGRIGTVGQVKMQTFVQEQAAVEACERMARRKRSRGYQDSGAPPATLVSGLPAISP